MKTGKLDAALLKQLLERFPISDPRVVLGPAIGEDAAVLDLGEESPVYWVVTADPITFTTDEIGYYGVVVNMNDIATRGATPRFLLATLLFPEKGSDRGWVEEIFDQIHDACRRFGISLVGGHTEITPGIERVIFSGHMIGEVRKDKLVTTRGARFGDLLILVKGVCIEGTSIIAREKEEQLLARGFPRAFIDKAKTFIYDPGLDVLRAAHIACKAASVHSMHDPTEGGLINGIAEMAIASGKEIHVDLGQVLVYDESRKLCEEYGLDPLGVIASGALLLTVSPSDLPALERAFEASSIPARVIGEVKEGRARVLAKDEAGLRELTLLPRDEILKIF